MGVGGGHGDPHLWYQLLVKLIGIGAGVILFLGKIEHPGMVPSKYCFGSDTPKQYLDGTMPESMLGKQGFYQESRA